jgi:hypothetical protein
MMSRVDDNHRFLESDDGSSVGIFLIIIAVSIAVACILNPFGCMLCMEGMCWMMGNFVKVSPT